jgi:putative flippase GtrA
MVTRLLDFSAVRFAAVGVFNTLLGLAVIYAGMYFLGLGTAPANAIGYAVGILTSFALNRNWTFGHRGEALPAFTRFLVVLGVAYLANLGTVMAASGKLGWNPYVAQALGVVPYTVISFLGSRHFAFRG